jgi:hypothetical protein
VENKVLESHLKASIEKGGQKIEELTKENEKLRLKLVSMEDGFDAEVHRLKTDIKQLRKSNKNISLKKNDFNSYDSDKIDHIGSIPENNVGLQKLIGNKTSIKNQNILSGMSYKDKNSDGVALSHDGFIKIYQQITANKTSFDKDSILKIDCRIETNLELAKSLHSLEATLPQLKELHISNVPKDDEDVRKFLEKFKIVDLEAFIFSAESDEIINVGPYVKGLQNVAKQSDYKIFEIIEAELDSNQIVDIMSAAKNSECISLS